MRTTLTLDKEAVRAIRQRAKKRGVSQSKAASELIRRGEKFQLTTRLVNGFPVFNTPPDFPTITAEEVYRILEEE